MRIWRARTSPSSRRSRSRRSLLPPYHATNLARIMLLAVFAMGYNLAFGYTGLLTLGHALFFAAGLYATGLLVAARRPPRPARAPRRRRRRQPSPPPPSASSRCAPPASPS